MKLLRNSKGVIAPVVVWSIILGCATFAKILRDTKTKNTGRAIQVIEDKRARH